MAKGENIFKRRDGRWEARYIRGYDPSGKIKYGFCYGKTYKQAKEKVTSARAAHSFGKGLPARSGRLTLESCSRDWLRIKKGRVKASTYVKYENAVLKHIIPKLGSFQLQRLNTEVVCAFSAGLLERGLAPKTVKDILIIFKQILAFTAKQHPGILPPVDIDYPKQIRREMRVLTRAEQSRMTAFLYNQMDECKFGILLALLTGIRIGELCALKWGDISFTEKTVHIKATLQRLKDVESITARRTKIVIGPPKSERAERVIPLGAQAFSLCLQMKRKETAYVLTGTEQYMEPRTLQNRLQKITKACQLTGVHFHTLRHTFATRCVEVGFDIKSLSEILGHACSATTIDRYVHASMEFKRDNMKKLKAVGL